MGYLLEYATLWYIKDCSGVSMLGGIEYAPSKKHEICEFNAWIDKMVVDRDRERASQPERQSHTSKSYGDANAGMFPDNVCVDFQTNQKKEKAQPYIGNQRKIRDRLLGKYVLRKTRYPSTYRGS